MKPKATVRRVDEPPADPELSLFRAYSRLEPGQTGMFRVARRLEPCACGGELALFSDAIVEQVVAAHNESALHQAWRAWRDAGA